MRSQTKKFEFLPFEYRRHGLKMNIEQVMLEGVVIEADDENASEISGPAQLIKLEDYVEKDCESVTVRGTIAVQDGVLESVLPEVEHDAAPLRLALIHRCNATFHRDAEVLYEDEASIESAKGPFDFTCEFTVNEFWGKIELEPVLVRTRKREETGGRLASHRFEKIAAGRPWVVRLDRKTGPPGAYLQVSFKDFATLEGLPDDESLVYYLQCDGPDPILWLNNNHNSIVGVLKSKGTRGGSARMRDVFFDQITISVWSQLFAEAVAELDEDGETPFEWQIAALGHLGDLLYPEMSFEEQLDQLYARAREPAEFASLLRRADQLLQSENELSAHMRKLVDEVQGD